MSEEQKSGMNRRDFLKFAGLGALAAQAVGFVAAGNATGASSETYTGWESFNPGTQFFNRKPFEVEYPNFEPVAEVRRPSHLTDYVFGRVATFAGDITVHYRRYDHERRGIEANLFLDDMTFIGPD